MQAERQPGDDRIQSPFAQTEATLSPKRNRSKLFMLAGIALFVLIGGVIGGIYVNHYLSDPYRVLEFFPVSKYLEDPHTLYGSKFKAELRVENDLGWKDGVGRLMLFSTVSDARPLAVIVPANVAKDIYFTKGQTYMAEFEVKEGGLIYAMACHKD